MGQLQKTMLIQAMATTKAAEIVNAQQLSQVPNFQPNQPAAHGPPINMILATMENLVI